MRVDHAGELTARRPGPLHRHGVQPWHREALAHRLVGVIPLPRQGRQTAGGGRQPACSVVRVGLVGPVTRIAARDLSVGRIRHRGDRTSPVGACLQPAGAHRCTKSPCSAGHHLDEASVGVVAVAGDAVVAIGERRELAQLVVRVSHGDPGRVLDRREIAEGVVCRRHGAVGARRRQREATRSVRLRRDTTTQVATAQQTCGLVVLEGGVLAGGAVVHSRRQAGRRVVGELRLELAADPLLERLTAVVVGDGRDYAVAVYQLLEVALGVVRRAGDVTERVGAPPPPGENDHRGGGRRQPTNGMLVRGEGAVAARRLRPVWYPTDTRARFGRRARGRSSARSAVSRRGTCCVQKQQVTILPKSGQFVSVGRQQLQTMTSGTGDKLAARTRTRPPAQGVPP